MANSWGTLTFEIPDFLDDIRNAINSVAEWMVAVLDIALLALNFIKAFLVGFLDPIIALVQALIDEINALLRDLRQLGLYLTGDWNLLEDPDTLKGGFQEYERRMIARLTDRTDPSRPDVSAATTVLSMFFYVSVDLSEWERLDRTIRMLLAYFKQFPALASSHPAVAITEVLYGASAANLMDFGDIGAFFTKESTPPALALVKWRVDKAFKGDAFLPPISIPPGGFIVTVSTVPEGIPIVYDRPQGDQDKKKVPGTSTLAQPREYGPVLMSDGRPLILYGGGEMIYPVPASMTYNWGIKDGALVDGATRVYGLLGSGRTPIPIDLLKNGDDYYLQRTFWVSPKAVGGAFATGEYSILLKGEEMPRAAHVVADSGGELQFVDDGPAATLYVRVATCSKAVANSGAFRYQFQEGTKSITGQPIQVGVSSDGVEEGKSPTDIGSFSNPQQIVFANTNTKEYLDALRVALLVLVLVRPDLQPLDEIEGTVSTETFENLKSSKVITEGLALGYCGLESVQHLTGVVYDQKLSYADAMKVSDATVLTFRQDLIARINLAAHDIYSKTGPMPDVEATVVSGTKFLRTATWGDILDAVHPEVTSDGKPSGWAAFLDLTLWESLESSDPKIGVARNPLSVLGGLEDVARSLMGNPDVTLDRDPHMQDGLVDANAGKWDNYKFMEMAFGSKEELQTFLKECPPGLRSIYEQCVVQPDNKDIAVPDDWFHRVDTSDMAERHVGSADLSPVFFYGPPIPDKMMYCRGLFVKSDLVTAQDASKGRILQQASLALRVAGAAIRRPLSDGEWLFVRWFDTMPGLEDFLASLANWMEAIRASLQSIIDTIRKYIEYLEARIVDLQQLIRRINALLQSILGFTFQIPSCSVLTMVSNGTGGVLSDLITADNKPSDTPLAYGGGVAVVIPLFPSFVLLDLLLAFWHPKSGKPDGPMGEDPTTVEGINGVPVVPSDPVVPDVL